MKNRSRKQAKLLRETDAMRYGDLRAGAFCEFNCGRQATEPHEIAAGASRHRALREPLAQMKVCRSCHERFQSQPFAVQVAHKIRAIVDACNRCLRDNGGQAFDESDVIRELRKLL